MKNLRLHLLSLAVLTVGSTPAADHFWDGGGINIVGDGNSVSTYASGTWSTAISNWDQGAAPHVAWNNASLDNAIFSGTYATGGGNRVITIGTDITVNQIQILIGGAGSNSRYDIGANAAQNDFAITFGGTYSDVFPAITGTAGTNGFINNNFPAKISGAVSGGLVLKHGSNITTPGTSGRFAFTNTNNNFTGDIVVAGGNLSATGTATFGNAANKIVLKGGALFISSGSAVTNTFVRNIEVAGASGIATNAATAGLQILDLTGALTGTADLIRYASVSGSATSDLRLSGDLSGFTGLFENRGPATAVLTLQPTAPSGGSWKLAGGTMKLSTATDDTAIGHGPGKSDLLMNGGALDLNGKSETINGLSGPTGSVTDGAAATVSTLTLGAGDATASFGGSIQNGAGTVALTKTGSGTQTLGGNCSFTGATLVEAGSLVMSGTMADSPVTVKSTASFTVSGAGKDLQALTLEDDTTFSAPLDFLGSGYLGVDDVLTFTGGNVTIVPTFADAPVLGTYDLILPTGGITGSATLSADFSANGATRVSGSAQAVDGVVSVTISSLGASITWNNATTTDTWDLNGDANFLNGAGNDVFKQYDAVTFGASSPAGSIALEGTLLPSSVTVDSSNNFTFGGSGSIAGAASLTKSGNGILTVANTNSFSGGTMVDGGSLAVLGTLGSGDVNIAAGASLKGTGNVAGAVTVEGTLAPGASVGTLATGDMTLTGTYVCELDGATADKLVVTGDLDISGASLSLDVAGAPTALNYVIATYTGALTGSFAAAPAGYLIDTSIPGQIVLWPEPAAPPTGTITFEAGQGYSVDTDIAPLNGAATNAPFDGTNGWSRSVSGGAGRVVSSASSGEYLGGQALSATTGQTFIGALENAVQYTGSNTVTFDAQFTSGIGVGFMEDDDGDGLYDQGSGGANGDSGTAFGVGGAGPRFQLRLPDFGTETLSPLGGTAGNWYRVQVTIGEVVGGDRAITMTVRNLSTGSNLDFDAVAEGIQPWTTSVAAAAFGVAPEQADGIFVRITNGGANGAKIDNLRVTAVNPPLGTAYDTWMEAFTELEGDDLLAESDPDHDGIKNLLEFVLDGDPTLSDPSILPSGAVSGGNLVFTFKRRDDSEGLVNQIVQHSGNLSAWTDVVIGEESGAGYTVEELGAAPDQITVTIPTGGDPKKFARLMVEELP